MKASNMFDMMIKFNYSTHTSPMLPQDKTLMHGSYSNIETDIYFFIPWSVSCVFIDPYMRRYCNTIVFNILNLNRARSTKQMF